jgi:hypothetical protein
MTRFHVLVAVACCTVLLVSCNNNEQAGNKQASQASFDADACPSMIEFSDHYSRQWSFISTSGFPAENNSSEWVNAHSFQNADSLYRDFVSRNNHHEYIRVFRQFGAYFILAKMGYLKSAKSDPNKLSYYTNELIGANYHGFCVLYQCLAKLKKEGTDTFQISDMKSRILSYSSAMLDDSYLADHMKREDATSDAALKALAVKVENVAFLKLIKGI